MARTALGEYLTARRAQVTPEVAGLSTYGHRRVPGLRREEVATLAGMSIDYYIRLEQGRERRPSMQVLEALSQVLRLDDDARLHLYQVAGLHPATHHVDAPERVDPQLLRLMQMWSDNPAIVLGRAYDILAANALACALFGGFEQHTNLLMRTFLEPGARSFYPDWEQVARYTVAGFRILQGRTPDDLRVRQVIEELSRQSPAFVAMWKRHEARGKRLTSKRFHHPEVGDLSLFVNAFDVRSATGQELIVYHAEPASDSARALASLAAMITDEKRGFDAWCQE
ncbi:helix-turn-helix transcriptional regulator [Micromonospora azadirachtae]|uniref:Helix-turn-helix transcriptional regulator n=1 Tax=Micromonospora azadirachtae TaxID=1970735 RepID=A0ABW2ZVU2_9ACTN